MAEKIDHVLLVDDNPVARYSVSRILLHEGFRVTEAQTGLDALVCASQQPDLVLLDLNLPDISGYEVCKRLKADPGTTAIPVVHLTASFLDDLSKARGLEGGADGYLTHPVEPHVLIATIRALLRLRCTERRLTALLETETKARRAAEDARSELRRTDRAKEDFLAMLAHELRNPLEPILTAVHTLGMPGLAPDKLALSRDIILRQTMQMARLIDDLLDISRVNTGKIELRRERVELSALVKKTLDDHRAQLQARGLSLELVLPEDPLLVDADPARLVQVIGNLLHNAAKFSGGTGTIAVEASADPVTEQVSLSVRDHGIGMTPEVLGALFRPFVQGDRTFHRTHGGLGLGLALAQGLVTLHGGTIEARSDGPGRGSEFIVRLPLDGTTPEAPQALAPVKENDRRLRVLIVEDHVDAATALQDFLELSGHTARVEHSGSSAVAAAREMRPDVVLCDLGLPGMDGFAVAEALRRDPATSGTYLLALSGYAQAEDRRRSKSAGFDLHLTKPIHPEELSRVILQCPRRVNEEN